MIWYNIKLAFRNSFKNKGITLINVIGLSLGITTVVLLSSFISVELKRGTHLPGYKHVYSIQSKSYSRLSNPMVELFRNNIPEIEKLTSFREDYFEKAKFTYKEKDYDVSDLMIGDSLFFDIFKFPVIYGNLEEALDAPNSIVLTKTYAEKIFGQANLIGEQIMLKTTEGKENLFTLKAVIEDIPKNAIFQFEGVFSSSTLKSEPGYEQNMAHWGNCNFIAYFVMDNPELIASIEEKANSSFQEEAPAWIKEDEMGFEVKSYSSLYFDTQSADSLKHGNKLLVNIRSVIGVLILIICLINYLNLNLAKEETSSHVNLVHKYLGARTANIINKGLFEMMPNLIFAMGLSVIISYLLLPGYNQLVDMDITFKELFGFPNNMVVVLTIVLSLLIGGVFSGIYQTGKVKLSKKRANTPKAFYFRSLLVVSQFVISIVFIVFTISIFKQINYMQSKPLGFQTENIIYLNLQEAMEGSQVSFKDELMKIPGITDATFTSSILGNVFQEWGMSLKNKGQDSRVGYNAMFVDKNYFDFYGIKFTEGTNFLENSAKERHHIFNQKAISDFGINDINEAFITSYTGASGDVIGVVEDFNFNKLDAPIANLGFLSGDPEYLRFLCLKTDALSPLAIKELLKNIENTWNEFVPDWPIDYGFQDKTIAELYENEIRFSRIVIISAFVALFIACIGLLGISIFTIERRIKEIGIRKVNGAKTLEVLYLLNADFAKWVVLAFIIACPISYLAIGKWLDNFAYKTHLSGWVFVLSGLASLFIAIATVSFQSWRAATRNPVEALRYE